jgi:glutaconate CoA-transferase subunit A
VLLKRKPMAFLAEVVAAGRTGLHLHTFLASLDAEFLAVAGAIDEVHGGYVGFEQLGFAPGYDAAVADGQVRFVEYTEFLFVAGLRAAVAGLPFMPTKGGAGSQVLDELGFAEIDDPYGRETVVAVPAMAPDVTVVHAEAADARGNVLAPAHADFLSDADVVLARASDRVVVTCERIVSDEELRKDPRRVALYGYEVDAVVEISGGARPTAMPGFYEADTAAIRTYLQEAAAHPDGASGLLSRLL